MPRFSLLDTPHKGLRFALAELTTLAGSINFTQQPEVISLQQKAEAVFAFLEEHAEVEETFILPALEERMPGTTHFDQDDHARLHLLQDKIQQRLAELPSLMSQPEAALISGRQLYQDLSRLQAGHLEHMLEEETGTQVLMWECFSDAEMMEIYTRVISSFSPQSLMNSLQFILPTQTHQERSMMLKGMKAKAPAQVLDSVMELASRVLSEEAFEKLTAELYVAA